MRPTISTTLRALRVPALVLASAAPSFGQGGPGVGGGPVGPPLPPLDPTLYCPPLIADQGAPGSALEVSTTPQLGALLPIGPHLFVEPIGPGTNAYIGVGTTSPAARLHVAGGDVNVREAALVVRGTAPSPGLSLGASPALPRPHLVDDFTTILGGAMPEASFGSADWSLRTADPTFAALLQTGVSGASGTSRLSSDGPGGASLALDVGGQGHLLEASPGFGGGRWEATADGPSGSMVLDASRLDGDGHLEFEDETGNAVVRLDATDDAVGAGASLSMDSDQGDTVVTSRADLTGGGGLFLDGAGGNSLNLTAGWTTIGPELAMIDELGQPALSLAVLEPAHGAELKLYDTQSRETVWMRAGSALSVPEAFLRLENHSVFEAPFTGLELKTPEAAKSNVLELDSSSGHRIELIAQYGPGDTGGGLLVSRSGLPRLEIYDNALTLFDLSGVATIKYDGLTGDKNAIVPTSEGLREVYCSEAAEVWFEDAGSVRLSGGVAEVPLDPIYLQTVTVDEEHPLHVAATARGGPGVWVETLADRLVLHELPGGCGEALVDWRVQARRRGTAGLRLEPLDG